MVNDLDTFGACASQRDESRVIHALLIEPASRETIFARLTEDHFDDPIGKRIFKTLLSCWRRNISLDSDATIMQAVPGGDLSVDNFMRHGTPGAYGASWQDAIDALDKLELARRAMFNARTTIECAASADKDRGELLAELDALWRPVIESPVTAATKTLQEIAAEENAEFNATRDGTRRPVTWGLIHIDRACPIYPGQMAVVAGRPGMGKTAFAISSAAEQLRDGRRVGIISVEMDSTDILRRFYSNASGLPYGDIAGGLKGAGDERLRRYYDVQHQMQSRAGQLFIHGGEKVSLERIRTITFDWVKNKGVEVIWIDYLTDLDLPKHKDHHRRVELMSQGLRDLSRKDKLNVPLIVCAQLNRAAGDGYPKMHHLAGSAKIEQDAHVVILLDRPAHDRNAKRPYIDRHGNTKEMQGKAACWIAKNRNGPTPVVFTEYVGNTMTFQNERLYAGEDVPAARG
jgi:replicative DNA helicase